MPPDVFFETLKHGSVHCVEEPAKFVNAITSENWRATIMAYLQGHFVSEDEKEEKRMFLRACNYSIINDELYRGGVCTPLFKCVSRDEGKRSTPASALRTLAQGPWLAKLLRKISTGVRRWRTPTKLSAHAPIARSMLIIASSPWTKSTSYLRCGP